MYYQLISRTANRLHHIIFQTVPAQLSPQPADVHVQTAIERM
jgi:hypothetical protein